MGEAFILQRPLRRDNMLSGWDGPHVYGNSEQGKPPVDDCGCASPFHAGHKTWFERWGEAAISLLPTCSDNTKARLRDLASVILDTIKSLCVGLCALNYNNTA